MNVRRVFGVVLILALGACESGGGPPAPNVLARAGGMDFTADEAAEILLPQVQLPNEVAVAEALANLWIDYALLAIAAVEDSTLHNVSLGTLLEQQVNSEKVIALRDVVIKPDTAISEEELQALYEAELPGGRVRARHILLQVPAGSTEAQIDSVRSLTESIRARALAGEDFSALAREFSQDPGSGANGGELGTFGRGEMVPPFEEAAFAAEVGVVTDVVETTFGFHLVMVDERIIPPLEEARGQFLMQIQTRRVTAAESTYVANLTDAAQVEMQEGWFETVQSVTADPEMSLSGRAAERPLANYSGGAYTLGEFQEWVQNQPDAVQGELEAAPESQYDILLQNLIRSELLLEAASKEGIEISQARRDSISTVMQEGVVEVARSLGFFSLVPEGEESEEDMIRRTVHQILIGIVQQGQQVYPMGGFALALREQFGAQIFDAGAEMTVARVTELRNQAPPPPAGSIVPEQGIPAVPPDTAGAGG